MSRIIDAAVRLPRSLAHLGEGGLDRQIASLISIATQADLTEEVFGVVDDATELPLCDVALSGSAILGSSWGEFDAKYVL